MDDHDMTAFGAYHAAYAGDDAIISSDGSYDDIGMERLGLER
jgi:hypothetical protein